MSKLYNVTIKGTGYLNGNININKTVQLDEIVARKFIGGDRDVAIIELCRQHYPGVKVEKGRVSANVVPTKTETNTNSPSKNNLQKQSSTVYLSGSENSFNESKEKKQNNSSNFSGGNLLKSAGSFALGSITNSVMNEINGNIEEEKERKLEVREFKNKRNEIISTEIPDDKKSVFKYANNLIAELKSSGWSDGENHKNEFANACLSKIEQSKYVLIGLGAVNEANYLDNEIKKLKRKKYTQKYLAISLGAGFIAVIFILYLLGIIHD